MTLGGARGFAAAAAAPSYPKTLSVRMDSLMVKCLIAAIVYFVPQDIVFVSGLLGYWYNQAATIAPKKTHTDAEAALEDFKAKKGLDSATVSKARSTWYVSV